MCPSPTLTGRDVFPFKLKDTARHDRFWARESGLCRRVAFASYTAALDAEEQAAEIYAELVRRAAKLPWSEDPAAEPLGGPAWGVGWP
jgi:hypothetical protein